MSESTEFQKLAAGSVAVRISRLATAMMAMFLFWPAIVSATWNEPNMAISEYQKQEWHVEDGLPQSNVRTIVQGRDRRLLIGNSEGITSFDGTRFSSFAVGSSDNTAHEPVNSLLFSADGDLWIGTDDLGVIRKHGEAITYISEEAGFRQERVRNLFQDRTGAIWVATQNRVERIVGDKIEAFDSLGLVPGDITEPFAEDGRGRLFIVTEKGLFLYERSRPEPFEVSHQELGQVTAVYGDKAGTIWVGRSRGLLRLRATSDGGLIQEALKQVHGPVTTLVGDHDGNIWVGTKGHGICRVQANDQVTHWTTENGLSDDTIRSFLEDDEGNLWIGTLSGGLSRWRKSTLVPFGTPEGFPNTFAANVLADRKGNLWLGTWGSGLLRLRNGKLKQEHLPGSPLSNPIRALTEDSQGNIWIGTWFDGLYRFDGTEFRRYLTGYESPSNAISALLSEKNGELWVGTYTGLIRFRGGVPGRHQGEMFLPGMLVTSILQDSDGSVIAGTFKGLYRLKDSVVQAITEKDGLSNSFILSVSMDSKGGVWVGTKDGGIDFLSGKRAVHLTPAQGIPGYPVYSVMDDGRGMLWMSTTRGILRVPLQQMHDLVEGKRQSIEGYLLGKNDGMRSSESSGMSQPHSTRGPDGSLWFATAKGFVHTNTSAENVPLPPLQARITGFQANQADLPLTRPMALAPGLAEFTVAFDAIRLSNPAQVQFRYKLDGYDQDWTIVSGRHARYRKLPPGRYRFLVEARDAGEPWSGLVAETNLVQRPFFYQTAYFYVLILLAAGVLLVALFRWRISRVKGRIRLIMEERNRIAREWHDTLMASLAAISWQLEATRDKLGKHPREAGAALDLARNMVRHSQTEARRIIWDLQDETSPRGSLSEVLAKVLDGVSTRTNVNAGLRISGNEALLPPMAIHHLACICQEAVTNAVRHASPSSIEVELDYSSAHMTLSVRDNGCGFPANGAAVPGHFGLSVMEERARKLGGLIKIESLPGNGTQVVVEVPVQVPN